MVELFLGGCDYKRLRDKRKKIINVGYPSKIFILKIPKNHLYSRLRVVPHFSSGIVERGKRESLPAACRLFSRGVIFTRPRVSLALLSLRKNGVLLVVYLYSCSTSRFSALCIILSINTILELLKKISNPKIMILQAKQLQSRKFELATQCRRELSKR